MQQTSALIEARPSMCLCISVHCIWFTVKHCQCTAQQVAVLNAKVDIKQIVATDTGASPDHSARLLSAAQLVPCNQPQRLTNTERCAIAHLPEGHEDDRLDQHELEQGVVGGQQVMGPQVEQ